MPNGPVPAAAPGLPAYTLDDAANDIAHLAQLLDAIVEIAVGLPRRTKRDAELDRLDAFAWIGRDHARRVATSIATIGKGTRS